MLDRKKMGETRGKVADLFAKTPEGLTVREAARILKSPENTIDFHVRILVTGGNLVHTGTAALEDLGRPGNVYADRKHAKRSKAWIAKHNGDREKAAEKKAATKPKRKPAKKARKAAKRSKPKAKARKKSAPKKAKRSRGANPLASLVRAKPTPKPEAPAPSA